MPHGKQNQEESRDQPHPNFISKEDVQVPSTIHRTGCDLQGEQHIALKDNTKPLCQTVLRCVPVPLFKKIEAELNKTVVNNVIKPVDTPTDWCAPTVAVPKAEMSGSAWI